jgi:hypothetical protein
MLHFTRKCRRRGGAVPALVSVDNVTQVKHLCNGRDIRRCETAVVVISSSHRLVVVTSLLLAVVFGIVPRAQASNDALLKLLRILRDRGSITAQEYDDLVASADADTPPTAPPTTAVVPAAAVPAVAEVAARLQAVETQVARQESDVIKKALANKWYERIGLRGYTQFRFTRAGDPESGPALEVPADRSVGQSEALVIRRGRFILSGDVTDRVALYAQFDFNASTGAADYSLQMRDLYADIALDRNKAFRVRLGQSKVPFGWVNLQSSQNRLAMERPDALNSAVEGERDYGAYFMWASPEARRRFRDLVSQGLKGSGDYGVAAVGVFNGQGLNRSDQNGDFHLLARASYPFKRPGGQYFELGAHAYRGQFVSPTQALTSQNVTITPARDAEGVLDERVGVTAVVYPQPLGIEAEWNIGRGPELSADLSRISATRLHGGYVQVNYRQPTSRGAWFPFARWQYFDGARKFARNAPSFRLNELDLGVEVARWTELELVMSYTRTFERSRTGSFPYAISKGGNRLGFQVQWNY